MKKSDLKATLKPIIQEVVKEMIFEENGVLAHLIKEVVSAQPAMVIRENTQQPQQSDDWEESWKADRLEQLKRKEAVQASGVNSAQGKSLKSLNEKFGFDVFAGVKPIRGE